MIKALKNWWAQDDHPQGHELDLAVAITKLMVATMRMNDKLTDNEYNEIVSQLQRRFEKSEEECKTLVDDALSTAQDAKEFQLLVKQVNQEFSVDERAAIISKLWSVAMADGKVDLEEEQFVGRIGALLKVPHDLLIKARSDAGCDVV